MKVRLVDINQIKPYPGNPRIAKSAVSKVRASLQEFGWQQPIVVDSEMVIIVGHTRHQAAQELKMDKVPVLVADQLTAMQAKAYRIADNRIGSEAQFDPELLRIEIEELQANAVDLASLGFNAPELSALLAAPEDGTPKDDEKVAEPVISYNLIFDNEGEQAVWHDFLRYLKKQMPQVSTISARLTQFLQEGEYGARP